MKNQIHIRLMMIAAAAALATGTLVTGVTGCSGNRNERSTGQYIDDESIIVRVKKAFAENPNYKFGGVTVTSYRGTVQLGGTVGTPDQKQRAEDIAKGVEGVTRVENHIDIKPS